MKPITRIPINQLTGAHLLSGVQITTREAAIRMNFELDGTPYTVDTHFKGEHWTIIEKAVIGTRTGKGILLSHPVRGTYDNGVLNLRDGVSNRVVLQVGSRNGMPVLRWNPKRLFFNKKKRNQ